MGGTKNRGRGGGGGGRNNNRGKNPEDRQKLNKDPGVPGNDLRRAGERLVKRNTNKDASHFHTGHNGIFGSASGMAKLVAQRKADTDRQEEARMLGGMAADVDEEEFKDPEVEAQDAQARRRAQMAAMALGATRKQVQHEEMREFTREGQAEMTGYDGADHHGGAKMQDNSFKRFYNSLQRTREQSDVILEVLDARDPMGCQLKKIEKSIESQHGDSKQIVIVLNKADLVPDFVVDAWVKHFREVENREYVIPFTAAKDKRHTTGSFEGVDGPNSMSGAQGRQAGIARLFRVLRQIAKGDAGHRKHITVGLIGYPNVGKSSVINALKRRDVVGVGNTPGFTTGNTEVDLRSDIKILDCPGVVMPGEDTGDVILRGAVKVDQLVDPMAAVERLTERCDPVRLSAVYGIDEATANTIGSTQEFVKAVGIRRGRIRHGGVVDEAETARIILQDWNDGRVGYYTVPPDTELQLPAFIGSVGAPDGQDTARDFGADAADEDEAAHRQRGGASVITTLSSGLTVDGLPTFHLQMKEATGHAKRSTTHRPEDSDDDDYAPRSRARR